MSPRYNSPPNWPTPPAGWTPTPGWTPDPSWGPPPQGWQFWVEDSGASGETPGSMSAGAKDGSSAADRAVDTQEKKSWFARHKVLTAVGAFVLLIAAVGALNGAGDRNEESVAAAPISSAGVRDDEKSAEEIASDEEDEAERLAAEEAEAAAKAEEERLAEEQRLAEEAAAAEAAAAEAARIGSVAQQNAYRSATSYLDYTAFSRSGLINQLEFEGFGVADAEFAIARLEGEGGVDWNAQAAASAASYLDYTSFSRSGLIDQLVFEGFTAEQAEYGVSTTGL
jgi:hypothetical protein